MLRLTSPRFYPCTALGVVELLDRAGVELEGRHAVVIGRSALVGQPLAALLTHVRASVNERVVCFGLSGETRGSWRSSASSSSQLLSPKSPIFAAKCDGYPLPLEDEEPGRGNARG